MAGKDAPIRESEDLDSFWLRRVYPDASAALMFSQTPVDTIKDSCIVVLDANVLLLPYRLGAASLGEIKKLFGQLAEEDRVFLPAQAVREFLKHRANKIRDVLKDLGNQASQIQVVADRKVGFLEADPSYQELVECSQKIKDLKNDSLKTIAQIGDRLRNGIGLDPVTSTYREIFADRVVELDGDISDDDLKSEMGWRYRHSIPPGYKDRNKPDEGIGDFLIWKTILQLAAGKKNDCIFITEDAKSDWWVQSEGVFQPRLELVEEYRGLSGGKTLHLLPLSGFLKIYGAKGDIIDEALQVETTRRKVSSISEKRRTNQLLMRRRLKASEINDQSTLDTNSIFHEYNILLNEFSNISKEIENIDRALSDSELLEIISSDAFNELNQIKRDYEEKMQLNQQRRLYLENILGNSSLSTKIDFDKSIG